MIPRTDLDSFAILAAQTARQGGTADHACRRAAECQAQRLDAARDGTSPPACTCFPQQGERQYC